MPSGENPNLRPHACEPVLVKICRILSSAVSCEGGEGRDLLTLCIEVESADNYSSLVFESSSADHLPLSPFSGGGRGHRAVHWQEH